MKINAPIGNATYAPLFIRLTLGSYFVLAGVSKLPLLNAFIGQVKSLAVAPENVATLYATLLPYLEIFVGVAIAVGLWTTLTGLMAAVLLLSFVIAFGIFPGEFQIFSKDIILAGAALSLMFSGPGAYSADNLRKSGEAS
jgi:uncharacterized membrane protein YphA (DoxX/SURF4 family)